MGYYGRDKISGLTRWHERMLAKTVSIHINTDCLQAGFPMAVEQKLEQRDFLLCD
jgi:hypothetical protein